MLYILFPLIFMRDIIDDCKVVWGLYQFNEDDFLFKFYCWQDFTSLKVIDRSFFYWQLFLNSIFIVCVYPNYLKALEKLLKAELTD